MIRLNDDFTRALPGDPRRDVRARQVPRAVYSFVDPTPVRAPRLVAWSAEVAALLELPWSDDPPAAVVAALAGNGRFEGSAPYAARYGGHQFGNWAGQLGDGRAIGLGERITSAGARWEMQLKGAGPTPYSRGSDGRAVLRSSVREFLCSEAMHHLGVPTTRALSLVATGDDVLRDMLYDGNARMEPGAVVCRVAPSFLRFGSYEILRAGGEDDVLRALVGYTLDRFFPEIPAGPDRVARMFLEVCRRTGALLAHWMRVGFVHGVMNTDNMSVLGLTLDYGPYGWLDAYDPGWTPNTSDLPGKRYRYERQPHVALWNLGQLAAALRPLLPDLDAVHAGLRAYRDTYNTDFRAHLRARLGLATARDDDDARIEETLALLAAQETDMTLFFRALGELSLAPGASDEHRVRALSEAFYKPEAVDAAHTQRVGAFVASLAARVAAEGADEATWRARMRAANPMYVLRNYLAQQAIDAAEAGDDGPVRALLDVVRRPYDARPDLARFAEKRPDWARAKPGCSALSCSS
jgi:uncharacterized protein YdiU (UPF0061 family)